MIDLIDIITVHETLEELEVCLEGIKDKNLLESAIGGQQWYEDVVDKIIHVSYSIIANHVFNDGNKRTGLLILNKLTILGYNVDRAELADIILELASSRIDKETYFKAVREVLNYRIFKTNKGLKIRVNK